MSLASDGPSHFVLILENGVPVNTEDGVVPTGITEEIIIQEWMALGVQGSSMRPEWKSVSGKIDFIEVTPTIRDMLDRYRTNVLAILPTNIALTFVYSYPRRGEQRRVTYRDIQFPTINIESTRPNASMRNVPWQTGTPPVIG